jgi:hypothetical protein
LAATTKGKNTYPVTAFDPAITPLHELAHGVLHMQDAISASDPLGDCERYINKIRREMGQAERQNYLPNINWERSWKRRPSACLPN